LPFTAQQNTSHLTHSTSNAQSQVGEFVDIVGNGAIHKGMPHKFYHGRTGRVFNITTRAIGVEMNKRVGNRILKKRIHVRTEHARRSRCREDFLRRVVENDKNAHAAKKTGGAFNPFNFFVQLDGLFFLL
jgi:ribosomal protein L21E